MNDGRWGGGGGVRRDWEEGRGGGGDVALNSFADQVNDIYSMTLISINFAEDFFLERDREGGER